MGEREGDRQGGRERVHSGHKRWEDILIYTIERNRHIHCNKTRRSPPTQKLLWPLAQNGGVKGRRKIQRGEHVIEIIVLIKHLHLRRGLCIPFGHTLAISRRRASHGISWRISEQAIHTRHGSKGWLARKLRLREQIVTSQNMDEMIEHFLLLCSLRHEGCILV